MSQISVVLSLDNAAFDELPGAEVERILTKLADKLEYADLWTPRQDTINLYDINGDVVGQAHLPQ